jgi:hypothetical protein
MRNRKRDAYRLDDDGIAADGEVVRRPMLLMDSGDRAGRVTLSDTYRLDRPMKLRDLELHRPGYRTIESGRNFTHFPDARRKKRDDEDEDEPDFGASAEKIEDVRRPSIAARDSYVAGLQTAWRIAAPSPRLTSEPPRPSAGHRTRDAAEPDRDAEYERRKAELSEAWKATPKPPMARPDRTDPQELAMNWRGGR